MTCTHSRERSRWVTRVCDRTGEEYSEWEYTEENTTVDVGIGAFKCTQCGEVMYYTGSWKEYYTEGTPCPGSEYSERIGDTAKVRAELRAKS